MELVIRNFLRFLNCGKKEFSVTLYGKEAKAYILIRKELWNTANFLDNLSWKLKNLVKLVNHLNKETK